MVFSEALAQNYPFSIGFKVYFPKIILEAVELDLNTLGQLSPLVNKDIKPFRILSSYV